MKRKLGINGSLVGGMLAAVGASLCCVGPLVLVMLGIGGTWVSTLTAVEPLRPVFILLVLLFFGIAFRQLYLRTTVCAADKPCADTVVKGRQRAIFWTAALMVLILVAFPWYAPLFY